MIEQRLTIIAGNGTVKTEIATREAPEMSLALENLIKVATSISESACNMSRYLQDVDLENASETHKFIDRFAPVMFGSHDLKGWIFSCKSREDFNNLYNLLSVRGPLFRRAFKQAGNRQKEFEISLDKLPRVVKKRITNTPDSNQLGSVFRDHLVASKQRLPIGQNASLRYDMLEYFLWRFLFSPLLANHQSVGLTSSELYLKLFVEYCDFFLSRTPKLEPYWDGGESGEKGLSLFYALKNTSLAFEAIHIKDYSKFVQNMEYFFISFIDEFWLIPPASLYASWNESGISVGSGSKESVSCNVSPSEVLLAGLNEFLDYVSDSPQENPTKKYAINKIKFNLFTFIDGVWKSSLPIDSEFLVVGCWLSVMRSIPLVNSSCLESDFAIYYVLFAGFVEYLATKSTLISCSNLDSVKREVKSIIIPLLNFYSSSSPELLSTLALYEQILLDGEANKFESKGFSHDKYQALKLALSEYEWKEKIGNVAFLSERSNSSNPLLLVALLQRAREFVIVNGRIDAKEEFLHLFDQALASISSMFSIDTTKVSWQSLLQKSRPSARVESSSSLPAKRTTTSRKFNVVTDESIAKWSNQQHRTNPSQMHEIRLAVYLFSFVCFVLNWITLHAFSVLRRATKRELKFLDRIPKWNLRRFAAWQWLITIPVWYLLIKIFCLARWRLKLAMCLVFLLLGLVHHFWLRNRVIFL